MQAQWAFSHLGGENAAYLEQLFEAYLRDPGAVPGEWREYFSRLPAVNGGVDISHQAIREQFRHLSRDLPSQPQRLAGTAVGTPSAPAAARHDARQVRVLQLINAYRFCGHRLASFNPLGLQTPVDIPELGLQHHGLHESDLDTVFDTGSLVGPDRASLKDILSLLTKTYCGGIGAEYMYIGNTDEKRWLQQRIEGVQGQPNFSVQDRRQLLQRVMAAEGLEHYLHNKYIGQKRFSLEGAESLIPMLDNIVHHAGGHGLKEVIIGMAHRGRLNVLINIMGKNPAELFREFEGVAGKNQSGSGDVKYHKGFSSNVVTDHGVVHVALAFNPSHLEIVGPVVEGSVRARQDRRGDNSGDEVVPILIHGDAAFAAQGVVMETFNMSQSRGYSTKGTIHIIINNQIGFTTSDRQDARSTMYCTDVAKMVNAPIFHVDGDDPEAVVFVTRLALDYRMAFHKDVVIDMVCYRRHGHSEADEPMVTQPMMYKTIRSKPTTRAIYTERLINEGVLTEADSKAMLAEYRDNLDAENGVVENLVSDEEAGYSYAADWTRFESNGYVSTIDTTVSLEHIRELATALQRLPEGFELHPSVAKIMGNRRKMAAGSLPVDWGFAESIAFASLLTDGFNIRLSGQDSGRGTFFHRHALVYNQQTGHSYLPLRHLGMEQGRFLVINSLLSEEAVLAYEYGYATTDPNTLTIWEAQFGDFANNAQVVIDQFISAGEQKWSRISNLVMLLPHGYEGQGPEHSSARLERYLQLCAEHNMQVCVPSSPAQIFHLLRRQMNDQYRKPLVVMSPKSLLRNRLAVNTLEDLAEGTFQCVLPEMDDLDDRKVSRIVFCCGKVYYDLLEKRRENNINDVAIIRIEQLYPFPKAALKEQTDRYSNASSFIWCQDEPRNQGAWYSSQHHIRKVLGKEKYLLYSGRDISAAPAVGSPSIHVQQQRSLINGALGLEGND